MVGTAGYKCEAKWKRTFSNLRRTGGGFSAVTAAAISSPARKAASSLQFGMRTNIESVSP